MDEEFWERKGVKLAVVWIVLDAIVFVLLLINGFSLEFIKEYWLLLLLVVVNIDRIVIPLANLPEPPRIFTFLVGIIPAGVLIAYVVSLSKASPEAQLKIGIVLLITLILWNAANIGWGIWAKKKSS